MWRAGRARGGLGVAEVLLACALSRRGGVTSTSPAAAVGLADAVSASRSACGAMTVAGAARATREEDVQNHTAAITTAVKTLANIRPNALRIATLPKDKNLTKPLMRKKA